MKPTLRDYLTILIALLAIFLCGYGVGFLLGEKKGRDQASFSALTTGNENDTGDWEALTMERLTRLLSLTEEQKSKILGSLL